MDIDSWHNAYNLNKNKSLLIRVLFVVLCTHNYNEHRKLIRSNTDIDYPDSSQIHQHNPVLPTCDASNTFVAHIVK